jgi:hypothetical protein
MSASTTMPSAGPAAPSPVAPPALVGAASVPVVVGTPPHRRRSRATIAMEEVARGASEEVLARPAGEVFDAMPWAGASPDPDVLDAMTFLAWL